MDYRIRTARGTFAPAPRVGATVRGTSSRYGEFTGRVLDGPATKAGYVRVMYRLSGVTLYGQYRVEDLTILDD